MWQERSVLVTGGASFIGSHLVDRLVERGARVRIVDDLSSGSLENVRGHLDARAIDLRIGDLRDPRVAADAVAGCRTVFHLAAIHGGRGFVDVHPAECAENLVLDGVTFRACKDAGVEKIVYASSGCVYPSYVQSNAAEELFLDEARVGPPYDADNTYGWAKLMGELTLQSFAKAYGIKSVSCRYFTVYGERGVENHAIMAMIARAFIRQNPMVVWGDGQQIRNWTHVDDIVSGTLLAAERIDDASAVNLGTMERTRVIDAARRVMELLRHEAPIELRPDMPTGPRNRVADNARARELLGWSPRVDLETGLARTVAWYERTKARAVVEKTLPSRLLTRTHAGDADRVSAAASSVAGGVVD